MPAAILMGDISCRHGSTKESLQTIAVENFKLCLRYDIQLISKWIPRGENELADSISKYCDTDGWGIDDETFYYIQCQFGFFDIDRFADSTNKRTHRFDSRYYCEDAENVNTFTSHWGHDFNWLCPPISQIGETLQHANLCESRGVLLIPEWKSSYFWPLITPCGRYFYSFVKEFLVLDPYFQSGGRTSSVFSGFAKFRTLALLVDFSTRNATDEH